MANKIMDFLFGRFPRIFNKKGEVVHDLGSPSWKGWKDRYHKADYDWRNHSGRGRKIDSNKN